MRRLVAAGLGLALCGGWPAYARDGVDCAVQAQILGMVAESAPHCQAQPNLTLMDQARATCVAVNGEQAFSAGFNQGSDKFDRDAKAVGLPKLCGVVRRSYPDFYGP